MTFEITEGRMRRTIAADVARAISAHFQYTRGAGHTHAVIHGLDSAPEASVIVAHRDQLPYIEQHRKVPLEDCPRHLQGRRFPLVIDNYALQELLEALLWDIDITRAERDSSMEEAESYCRRLVKAEKRLARLEGTAVCLKKQRRRP